MPHAVQREECTTGNELHSDIFTDYKKNELFPNNHRTLTRCRLISTQISLRTINLPGGGVTSARSSTLRLCCCCPSFCKGLLSCGFAVVGASCSTLSELAAFCAPSRFWLGEEVARAAPLFPSPLGPPSSSSGSLSKAGLVRKTSPQRPQRNLPEHLKEWQRMQNVWALFLSRSSSKVESAVLLLRTESKKKTRYDVNRMFYKQAVKEEG